MSDREPNVSPDCAVEGQIAAQALYDKGEDHNK
jgi:hypothetical protein